MTPRDVIAESIYSNNVGGTSDPTLLALAEGFAIDSANHAIAALSAAGFAIVPRMPTKAMIEAAWRNVGIREPDATAVYLSMLAAAESDDGK